MARRHSETGSEADALVVDASVLAAVVFGESRADEVARLLRDRRLVAPTLLWYEMSEVARVKCRAHPAEADAILEQFASSRRLPIALRSPEWQGLAPLALEYGLTAYDAAYLSLCRALGIPLATFDRQLEAAARKMVGGAGPGST
jgi:predicted nucleic acid-binding protein